VEAFMRITQFTLSSLFVALLAAQPALAQTKAQIAKTALDFQTQSIALSNNLSDLSKRVATASPNDKDMLKRVISQVAVVDATASGVMVLGILAGEMRDAGDLATAKKHLSTSCKSLKSMSESTVTYVGTLTSNIASPATVAEVNKGKDLVAQLGRHALCAGK
jgi:hypothetical protein